MIDQHYETVRWATISALAIAFVAGIIGWDALALIVGAIGLLGVLALVD
jgi:hypothetical protein